MWINVSGNKCIALQCIKQQMAMFGATNMLSRSKMSEFKAHPVKAFLRVWAYLLILPNPVQRKQGDGKHRGLGSHCWATNTTAVYILIAYYILHLYLYICNCAFVYL